MGIGDVVGRTENGQGARLGVALLALLAAACLGGAAGAQGEEERQGAEPEVPADPEGDEPSPAADPPPRPEPPRYRGADEVARLLSGWLGSGVAERLELGSSAGGLAIEGIQFGGPGKIPLHERPTILLVGGLDGVSLAGSEAVLRITGELLAAPDRLPSEVSFVALPWANPDGLARWGEGRVGSGGNDRPVDDDGDGATDEDGPDDLDGDGLVLDLLIEDRDGPWARAEDDRLLRPARPGDAPRYRLAREGRDEDGDGRFNEDGRGGVCPDLNFPVGWQGPWTGIPSGRWPLSEPSSRALADLGLARRTVAVLFLQGNHGCVAIPGGDGAWGGPELPLEPDRMAFEMVTRAFARAAGRPQAAPKRLAEARGAPRPGSAIDWFYTALGALSLEVAPWGPRLQEGSRTGQGGRSATDARFEVGEDGKEAEPGGVAPADRDWIAWLDNTRGGIGFLDWQPVDLGEGFRGLVGGWMPRTRENPPPEALPGAVRGLSDFVLDLAASLPVLEVEVREVRREENGIVFLRARIRNTGRLPSGVGPAGRPGHGATLRLEIPEGVRLIVGEEEAHFGHVAGNGASAEREWLLVAPEGAVVRLFASCPWLGSVVREVRP